MGLKAKALPGHHGKQAARGGVRLSALQSSILLALGLQGNPIKEVEVTFLAQLATSRSRLSTKCDLD